MSRATSIGSSALGVSAGISTVVCAVVGALCTTGAWHLFELRVPDPWAAPPPTDNALVAFFEWVATVWGIAVEIVFLISCAGAAAGALGLVVSITLLVIALAWSRGWLATPTQD